MATDTSPPDQIRTVRGLALKRARKTAGLSAERLAQFVNERTPGSDVTRHAIYSYEQGKVLLSREVGHRIASALQLHPGQLLLGDPEYGPPTDQAITNAGADADVALRVALVRGAQGVLEPGRVLVRLLGQAKLGRVDISGYLDVFHLLLEDTESLIATRAFGHLQALGDNQGNEHPYALCCAVQALHDETDPLLKRLIDPQTRTPTDVFDDCRNTAQTLGGLLETLAGEIHAVTNGCRASASTTTDRTTPLPTYETARSVGGEAALDVFPPSTFHRPRPGRGRDLLRLCPLQGAVGKGAGRRRRLPGRADPRPRPDNVLQAARRRADLLARGAVRRERAAVLPQGQQLLALERRGLAVRGRLHPLQQPLQRQTPQEETRVAGSGTALRRGPLHPQLGLVRPRQVAGRQEPLLPTPGP